MSFAEPAPRPASRRWPGLLALAVTVFGARLWLIHHYGSALPFWDQWDAEGAHLIKPWVEHQLHFADLFAAHNEHRILFTRLLTLGLLQGNGLWDARLEMTANALLFSGVLTLMTAAVTRRLPAALFPVALGMTAVLGSLPFGWENTLGGFQSQFYFLLGFSLVVLWGLGMHAPFSWPWWVGVVATPLAGLSMAGGMFAPAVALGLRVLRGLRERRRSGEKSWLTRRETLNLGLLAALTAGAGLLVVKAPQHAPLHAQDIGEMLRAFGIGLAWPWRGGGWPCAVLMMAPGVLLLGVYLRGDRRRPEEFSPRWHAIADRPDSRGSEWLLGLGMLTLVQTLAVAYARGRGLEALPSRYLDGAAVGVGANALAAMLLAWRCRRRVRPLAAALAAAWLAQAGVGLWQQTDDDFTRLLPAKQSQGRGHEERVRGFVATDDFARYLTVQDQFALPFPSAEALARWLRDPSFRRVLPACVREPLPLEIVAGAGGPEDTFQPVPAGTPDIAWFPALPTGEHAWSSYSVAHGGDLAEGELVARLPAELSTAFLTIRHAGYVGQPGLTLELEDTRRGGRKTSLTLPGPAHETWVETPWRAPARRHLVLRATDHSARAWLAFGAPREDGPLSYRAALLVARGGTLFSLGLSGFLILGVVRLVGMTNDQ